MLPVATPPNAIAFGTGRLLTTDTVSLRPVFGQTIFIWTVSWFIFKLVAGSVPKLIGITIVNIFIAVFGPIVYNTGEYPCFAQVNFTKSSSIYKSTFWYQCSIILVRILLCGRWQSTAELSPWCEYLCSILLIFAQWSVFMFAKWLCITHCPSLSDNLLKRMILRITEIGYFFCSAFYTLKLPSWFQTL